MPLKGPLAVSGDILVGNLAKMGGQRCAPDIQPEEVTPAAEHPTGPGQAMIWPQMSEVLRLGNPGWNPRPRDRGGEMSSPTLEMRDRALESEG